MMRKPSIDRILDLQKLLLQFSQIDRRVHRKHKDEHIHETDTEHSYNLAMTAWFLSSHFPKLDQALLIRLALVHDLVEVHAGDTYVYADAATLASKAQREAEALQQLEADWSDFPDMLEHIKSYENKDSEEAKFIYALDKIMPMMQIFLNDGHTWKQEGITLRQLNDIKVDKISLSPAIATYYEQLYSILAKRPDLIP